MTGEARAATLKARPTRRGQSQANSHCTSTDFPACTSAQAGTAGALSLPRPAARLGCAYLPGAASE